MASVAGDPPPSFEAVLSSIRREFGSEGKPRAAAKPFPKVPSIADGEFVRGFAAAADLAYGDFAPPPLPSDAVDAIASELALPGVADPASLRNLRRRFMWANHPDRRPDLPRDLANRRVAIANMLIDTALKGKRPPGR